MKNYENDVTLRIPKNRRIVNSETPTRFSAIFPPLLFNSAIIFHWRRLPKAKSIRQDSGILCLSCPSLSVGFRKKEGPAL